MSSNDHPPLAVPALRAQMGDWIYYIGFLKMRDIAERISIAEDIHSSKSLRDLLQRGLTNRSTAIKDYLLKQKQRFFNALVVATYGGSPEWTELVIRDAGSPLDSMIEPLEGTLGILTLRGSEKLFAVDGQHRVAGIQAAVRARKSLGDEEVCAIFVAGVTQEHRDDDSVGFERTRRLFTTLNRYAKPVTKRDIIALDEDDIVAITTRTLVEDHRLFRDKVSLTRGNSLPPSDRRSFTTITAVYDAMDTYLRIGRDWADFKKLRPADPDVKGFYRRAERLWSAFVSHFPRLEEMYDSGPSDEIAANHKGGHGGHLLFRPIGLLLAVRVVRHLTEEGVRLHTAMRRIARVPTDLAGEPWVGLLWDDTNRRMITTRENQRVAERLLVYLTGGSLSRLGSDEGRLRTELAGILNRPVDEYSLPAPL